jgi:hypothetical protein
MEGDEQGEQIEFVDSQGNVLDPESQVVVREFCDLVKGLAVEENPGGWFEAAYTMPPIKRGERGVFDRLDAVYEPLGFRGEPVESDFETLILSFGDEGGRLLGFQLTKDVQGEVLFANWYGDVQEPDEDDQPLLLGRIKTALEVVQLKAEAGGLQRIYPPEVLQHDRSVELEAAALNIMARLGIEDEDRIIFRYAGRQIEFHYGTIQTGAVVIIEKQFRKIASADFFTHIKNLQLVKGVELLVTLPNNERRVEIQRIEYVYSDYGEPDGLERYAEPTQYNARSYAPSDKWERTDAVVFNRLLRTLAVLKSSHIVSRD